RFAIQERVSGSATRQGVGQALGFAARRPSRCAHLVQAQQPAGLAPRPAATGSVVHQVEQSGLDGCVYASWNRAGSQSQCVFPSYKCKAIACSATVACNLATCSRVSSSSTCSGVLPARPVLADSAARAPSLAVRQIEVTVVRSTRHRAAASRCVYCAANTSVNAPYAGAGGRQFAGRRARLGERALLRALAGPARGGRERRARTLVSGTAARGARRAIHPPPGAGLPLRVLARQHLREHFVLLRRRQQTQ